jgi:Ca-activated chloride channel family protein
MVMAYPLRLGLSALLALAQFVSSVNLVEVYVSVTGPDGAPVLNLTRDDFVVTEDGQPQTIGAFIAGDAPLSVALSIDRSFSMTGPRLALARSAAHVFLGELRPGDRTMLLAIGSEVEVLAPLSADRTAQHEALARLTAWGTTSLHDAIVAGLDAIQPAEGRSALVVLSDGDDRYSRASAADVVELARRSDVLVYPIALGERRPPLFAELAALTGGRSFHLRDPQRLTDTLRAVARDLRHQYLLGYTPSRPIAAGGSAWRSIRVSVKRPGVTVRARDGYFVR